MRNGGGMNPVFFSALLLQAFVTKVETIEMPLLEQRLAESNARLCFLVDYVELSPADMDLNRLTVQWYRRMPSVFEDHRLILMDKTRHYQADLKVSARAQLMSVDLPIFHVSTYLSVC